jgi:hypothetical protein
MSYSIVIEGKMAEMMNEISERLEVDVETLGVMAISNFLNSPLVTSTLTYTVNEETERLVGLESLSRVESSPSKVPENNAPSVIGQAEIGDVEVTEATIREADIKFNRIRAEKVPPPEEDYILWGQFSRFLTIKYTLRLLANLSVDNRRVPLEMWFELVRSNAAAQRFILREIDILQKIPRGEQFASGFPKGGEKSLDRFVNHFCAAIYSDGAVVGFPSHLGLIRVSISDGRKVVRLTKAGLKYVKLYNPIIDGSAPYDSAMSDEEAHFILGRIRKHLPSTWDFFQHVLKSIEGGADTPTELSSAIDQAYGLGTPRNWNGAQVATYRSGALGLLGDCGIISRTWMSRSVTYSLTDKGKGVLV